MKGSTWAIGTLVITLVIGAGLGVAVSVGLNLVWQPDNARLLILSALLVVSGALLLIWWLGHEPPNLNNPPARLGQTGGKGGR